MKKHGRLYLHVGNSGVTFEIVDEGHGPTVLIHWGSFGNLVSELKVMTDKDALTKLGNLFLDAALKEYSPVYCNRAYDTSTEGGVTVSRPVEVDGPVIPGDSRNVKSTKSR